MSTQDPLELLQGWEAYCTEQSILHANARGYYKFLSRLLFIPACLLGSGSGLSSITVASSETYSIIFGVLSIVSAAMFSLHAKTGLDEKNFLHDQYCSNFYILANDIRAQLALHETGVWAYKSVSDYARECKQRLDILIDKAPSIPGRIARGKRCDAADMC